MTEDERFVKPFVLDALDELFVWPEKYEVLTLECGCEVNIFCHYCCIAGYKECQDIWTHMQESCLGALDNSQPRVHLIPLDRSAKNTCKYLRHYSTTHTFPEDMQRAAMEGYEP